MNFLNKRHWLCLCVGWSCSLCIYSTDHVRSIRFPKSISRAPRPRVHFHLSGNVFFFFGKMCEVFPSVQPPRRDDTLCFQWYGCGGVFSGSVLRRHYVKHKYSRIHIYRMLQTIHCERIPTSMFRYMQNDLLVGQHHCQPLNVQSATIIKQRRITITQKSPTLHTHTIYM